MVGLSAEHAARGARHPLVTEIARLREENETQAQALANLLIALQSSREIGTAVGILMHQRKATAEQAFELLRAASQQTQRKVRDLAHDVVFTGMLEQPAAPIEGPSARCPSHSREVRQTHPHRAV